MIIDENGEHLGVMTNEEAKKLAQEKGLDLVEVSPLAKPPVCRIIDYGKFQYKQARSQGKVKKTETKGVRLSLKIGQHDLDTKKKQALKFLDQGHKVKVELRLRGRERAFKSNAREVSTNFLKNLGTEFKQDKPIDLQGSLFTVIITKES